MKKSYLVAAAVSGLLLTSGCASTGSGSSAESTVGQCHGVNSCKGTGDCGGKDYSCAGKNSCKGKGWKKMTQSDCDEKGGTFKGV